MKQLQYETACKYLCVSKQCALQVKCSCDQEAKSILNADF